MGVWTHIDGEIRSKKVSMKKVVASVLDGEDCVFSYEHGKFSGRFEHGGFEAAKSIQKMLEAIKSYDSAATAEIHAEIRFLL